MLFPQPRLRVGHWRSWSSRIAAEDCDRLVVPVVGHSASAFVDGGANGVYLFDRLFYCKWHSEFSFFINGPVKGGDPIRSFKIEEAD